MAVIDVAKKDIKRDSLWAHRGRLMLVSLFFVAILWSVSELYLSWRGYETAKGVFADPICINVCPNVSINSTEIPSVIEGYWPNRMRASRCLCLKKRPLTVLFLGCSYTMGAAVPDNHTYVWRLGELCSKYDFDNGGVGAFGPWQCYLHLRDIFTPGKYDIVIYSSIADHCIRNPYAVYYILDGSIAFLPYVLNEDGQWTEHEAKIVTWPGDSISRTVNLIKNTFCVWRYNHNAASVQDASCRERNSKRYAMIKMRDYLKQRDIPFYYVTLDHHPEDWVNDLGIATCDACFIEWNRMMGDVRYKVSREAGAHPNAYTHDCWARIIAKWLNEH